MAFSYSLTIAGFPHRHTSLGMMSRGLRKGFSEIPEVEIVAFEETADVIVINDYFGSDFYKPEVTNRYRVVSSFNSVPHPDIPLNFCYWKHLTKECIPVGIPWDKTIYEKAKKEPGSVLVDHDGSPWNVVCQSREILSWLTSYDSPICQMEPYTTGTRRNFGIQQLAYNDYLKATERFDNFIVTHEGSCNYSAIDMAVRGTRVLVPMVRGAGQFVPHQVFRALGMENFYGRRHLLEILNTPNSDTPRLNSVSDYSEIASKMHTTFLPLLSKN